MASSSYSIDFTQVQSLPDDWILAGAANVTFGDQGAEFNFNKRKDAPYIWTNFYVAYGRIDVEMQVANGTGIITSSVMFSDDADEIDWEFSGSNFGAGAANGKIQTNVFAKGITGNYDRGTIQPASPPPQKAFHTYSLNWTPERIDWILDGNTLYSTTNNGQTTGNYQFPQTPSRLHLGIWDAGDPDTAWGTMNWAGGYTNYSQTPYVAYVKTVNITTPYPCKAWKYPSNFSGSWADVQCTNETLSTSQLPSVTSTSVAPTSTDATYTVVANDNGYVIAQKLGCTFDQLSAANPGVQWTLLIPGQILNNPNGVTATTSPASAASILATSSSSNVSIIPSTPINATSNVPAITSLSSVTQSTTGPRVITPFLKPGTSSTAVSTSSSKAATTAAPLTCTTDACLNSMTATKFLKSAASFCSTYVKKPVSATPKFLSGCKGNTSRVKSACSCLASKYSSRDVPAPTGSSAVNAGGKNAHIGNGHGFPPGDTFGGRGGWGWKRNDRSQGKRKGHHFGVAGAGRQHD